MASIWLAVSGAIVSLKRGEWLPSPGRVLVLLWVLLGSWLAVFPGMIEALLGLEYSCDDYWA